MKYRVTLERNTDKGVEVLFVTVTADSKGGASIQAEEENQGFTAVFTKLLGSDSNFS